MSRNNSYGFVDEEAYWNIGSEDLRGKDGDDARLAARKYNDHRHDAKELGGNTLAYYGFLHENKPLDNEGGLDYGINDPNTVAYLRKPGDLVRFKGLLWMYDEFNQAIPLGVGPGCYFQPDHTANNGRFVREATTSQELVCGREEIVFTESTPTNQDGVLVETNTAYREIGGVLLDMAMHSMHRARPMVRFECTGSMIHDGNTPYEALIIQNQALLAGTNVSIGTVLAEFLTFAEAKAGDVKFVWDRNGELPDTEAIREFPFITGVNEELSPLYINDATMGGVRTQRSKYILLDLSKEYVIRVRARLRTFETNAEIIDEWNRFQTVVLGGSYEGLPGINALPTLLDTFGGALGGDLDAESGQTVYDKIRYWQSSHCTFEILNVKIRIDNFLGLPQEVFEGERRTSIELPDDISEHYS